MNLLKKYSPCKRFYSGIETTTKWIFILYYKSILWLSYFTIVIILLSKEINLINSFVLFVILVTLLWHLFQIKLRNKSYNTKLYRFWVFLVFIITITVIMRYIYQFLKFEFIKTNLLSIKFIKFLDDYSELMGLKIYEQNHGENKLRMGIFYNILVLFFAVLSYHYLLMIRAYRKLICGEIDFSNLNSEKQSPSLFPQNSNKKNYEDLENNDPSIENRLINTDYQRKGNSVTDSFLVKDYFSNIRFIFEEYINVSIRKKM